MKENEILKFILDNEKLLKLYRNDWIFKSVVDSNIKQELKLVDCLVDCILVAHDVKDKFYDILERHIQNNQTRLIIPKK